MQRFGPNYLKSTDRVSPETFNPIISEFDKAIDALEETQIDWQEQVDLFNTNALKRFNDAIQPVLEKINAAAEGGFLVAETADNVALVVGQQVSFYIPPHARVAFRPTPFLAVVAPDVSNDWAAAQLVQYNDVTGLLIASILYVNGSGAARSGWTVAASSGVVVAVHQWMTETKAARDAAVAANTAAQQAATIVSAAAILIAGGPVSTVDGKVGTVFTDPTTVTPVAPTLDLHFTTRFGAPFDFLTRATNGGYRQRANGLYVSTTVNEPVIDFSAGTALGTGLYGAYTNLLLRSEEFDNAAWSKWGTTPGVVTANNVAAPDGNLTADRFVGSAADCGIAQQLTGLTIGDVVNGSVWLRADAATTVNLYVIEGGTGNNNVRACALTTEWQRFDVTRTLVSTTPSLQIGGAGSLTNKTIYVWGAQFTKTAFVVPYVPTTSATVARNADSMVISGTDFTDIFNPVEGTFLVAFNAIPKLSHLFHVTRGLGTYGPRLQCIINSNGYPGWAVVDDTNTVISDLIGAATVATSGVLAMSYKANEFGVSLNGAAAAVDGAGAVPTGLTRLEVGRSPDGGIAANGNIRRLIYWPKALTATELQRMTA